MPLDPAAPPPPIPIQSRSADPSLPPLVELEGVKRSFGKIQALKEVTLSLPAGRIGLVGNNGAGKSTLFKILLGLLRPDSGRGRILGIDVDQSGVELRRRIGYMPEGPVLVPLLTGVEFVSLSGSLYGMPSREAARRAHEVLQYVGLGELRYRRLEEYSLGNSQRLKLAAALVHDPELLLLDEPTDGLDPPGREGLLRLLADLVRETGKSLILSTHLLHDVDRLCDQLVVIEAGEIRYCGRTRPEQALPEQVLPGRTRRERLLELAWKGPDAPFRAALEEAGLALRSGLRGESQLAVADDFAPARLFAIARRAGVLLTLLKPVEENVEEAFFRWTAPEAGHVG